jgi:2-C-methyl-D-erythritol 4-phosphate cytidylyltransferase
VTDDAQVLELVSGKKSRLIPGSYRNIKVTTPEDLAVAELFLNKI